MYGSCTSDDSLQRKQKQEATQDVDSASVVTDLMMSRRSIRAYKDSTVSRETLNEILKCGINAPNGKNLQSYEILTLSRKLW